MADVTINNDEGPAATATIGINVLFFASAREAAGGVSQIALRLPQATATTAVVRQTLADKYPGALATMVLDEVSITFAVNEEYLEPNQIVTLQNGDTVALIPPISGG